MRRRSIWGMCLEWSQEETSLSLSEAEHKSSVKKTSVSITSIPDITMDNYLILNASNTTYTYRGHALTLQAYNQQQYLRKGQKIKRYRSCVKNMLLIEKKYTTYKILFKGFSPFSRIALNVTLDHPIPDWKKTPPLVASQKTPSCSYPNGCR